MRSIELNVLCLTLETLAPNGCFSITPRENGDLHIPSCGWAGCLMFHLVPRVPEMGSKNMNFDQFIRSWHVTFGEQPILAAAVLWQARNGAEELAAALGLPLPSVKSIGRLLAARENRESGDCRLVRCPGRIGNSAVWRVVQVKG